jgi:hypothetical protein
MHWQRIIFLSFTSNKKICYIHQILLKECDVRTFSKHRIILHVFANVNSKRPKILDYLSVIVLYEIGR